MQQEWKIFSDNVKKRTGFLRRDPSRIRLSIAIVRKVVWNESVITLRACGLGLGILVLGAQWVQDGENTDLKIASNSLMGYFNVASWLL